MSINKPRLPNFEFKDNQDVITDIIQSIYVYNQTILQQYPKDYILYYIHLFIRFIKITYSLKISYKKQQHRILK